MHQGVTYMGPMKLATGQRIAFACIALFGASFTGAQEIETLEPGVITVAVTRANATDPYDSQTWIREYVELFAADIGLEIEWLVVPFNESWLLASNDDVDLVATNVANFPDRASEGASWSSAFMFERRALRIDPEDEGKYHHIDDFVGKTVGVVSGMAAERDVDRRAPEGVVIRRATTFEQLYEWFDNGQLDAIAEAEYYALDDSVIPSHDGSVVLIDHHDLNPGQREESVFVIRDKSVGLLEAIDDFIARTTFPP